MKYYIVDAFTNEQFKGNPAGVCILDHLISDAVMQKIATENNLSETAFVYKCGTTYKLKWFTPAFEIDLCGHATLATAFVIFHFVEPDLNEIEFETVSGILSVKRGDNRNLYEMSFPQRPAKQIAPTEELIKKLGFEPLALYSERDLYVLMKNEQEVKAFIPDYDKLQQLDEWLGIVITAPGEDSDFVSRYFCPELKMEDPVTGSSHCSLIPFWSKKCNKTKLLAKQLSPRGGMLFCELGKQDVKIAGGAVLYLAGEIAL